MINVLFVDDRCKKDPYELQYGQKLKNRDIEVRFEPDGNKTLSILKAADGQIQLLILDLIFEGPNQQGQQILDEVKKSFPDLPVIILTQVDKHTEAQECLERGAYDYFVKPMDNHQIDKLANQIRKVVNFVNDLRENRRLKSEAMREMVGNSPVFRKVKQDIEKFASMNYTVLITGETGTGKELVAKAIHELNPRNGKPFVTVNCGAIAESLAESTLFGHEKGAFTGAARQTKGVFEQANQGTIFLDEIGELTPAMQVKLLRVLQEGEIYRVGGTEIKVDTRVIAATNRDLQEEVKQKKFREDLFHRLNVLSIQLPPLRERKEDILPLVEAFIKRFNDENQCKILISKETESFLINFDWPGNIRQLNNYVVKAGVNYILETGGTSHYLRPSHLPPDLMPTSLKPSRPVVPPPPADEVSIPLIIRRGDAPTLSFQQRMEEIEREAIQVALKFTGDNKTQAAKLLNMPKPTFDRKIKKYGMTSSN